MSALILFVLNVNCFWVFSFTLSFFYFHSSMLFIYILSLSLRLLKSALKGVREKVG